LEPSAGAKSQNSVTPLGSTVGTTLYTTVYRGAKVLPLRILDEQRNTRDDRPPRSPVIRRAPGSVQ
jgi:hypothetical protein